MFFEQSKYRKVPQEWRSIWIALKTEANRFFFFSIFKDDHQPSGHGFFLNFILVGAQTFAGEFQPCFATFHSRLGAPFGGLIASHTPIESEKIPGLIAASYLPLMSFFFNIFFIPPVLSNRASSHFFFSSFQALETPHRDAVCCATTQKTLSYEGPSGPKVAKVDLLGGGLKRLLFSPQTLGKCSKLTSIFFRWVWGSQP